VKVSVYKVADPTHDVEVRTALPNTGTVVPGTVYQPVEAEIVAVGAPAATVKVEGKVTVIVSALKVPVILIAVG